MEPHIAGEAVEGGDLCGGRAADADVHGHAAEQEQAKAIGQVHGLFFEQGKDASANVGGPRREGVGLAQGAHLVVGDETLAHLKVVERDARLDGQAAVVALHGADAQRAVGARLEGDDHAPAEDALADVAAGIVGNAAHDVEAGGDAGDPNLAGAKKAGEAGGIAVGLFEKGLKLDDLGG